MADTTDSQAMRDYQKAVGAKPTEGSPGGPPSTLQAGGAGIGAGVKKFRPQGKDESIQDFIKAKKAWAEDQNKTQTEALTK
jgi:hypothetical protein